MVPDAVILHESTDDSSYNVIFSLSSALTQNANESGIVHSTGINFDAISNITNINWDEVLYGYNESELIDKVIDEIGSIEEVEKVFMYIKRNIATIWTIIDDDEARVLEEIFEKEGNLIDQFDNILFDFQVIIRRNRSLASIVTFEEEPIFER